MTSWDTARLVRARITTLGGCGGWPEAGRACSGFVIEHDGFRLVLDLGYGTLPRLLDLLGSSVADGLDAIVITHEHADHMVDLHGLFRARWFGQGDGRRISLYAPEPVLGKVIALGDPAAAEDLRIVFSWYPLPAASYEVGPFTLESVALPHHVLTAGVRLTAPGLTIAYTGDSGPDPALVISAVTPTSTSLTLPTQLHPSLRLASLDCCSVQLKPARSRTLPAHSVCC